MDSHWHSLACAASSLHNHGKISSIVTWLLSCLANKLWVHELKFNNNNNIICYGDIKIGMFGNIKEYIANNKLNEKEGEGIIPKNTYNT